MHALNGAGAPLSSLEGEVTVLAKSIGIEVLKVLCDPKEVGATIADLVDTYVIHCRAMKRLKRQYAITKGDYDYLYTSIYRARRDTLLLFGRKIYAAPTDSQEGATVLVALFVAMCAHSKDL